jgi:hypothetical protein
MMLKAAGGTVQLVLMLSASPHTVPFLLVQLLLLQHDLVCSSVCVAASPRCGCMSGRTQETSPTSALFVTTVPASKAICGHMSDGTPGTSRTNARTCGHHFMFLYA